MDPEDGTSTGRDSVSRELRGQFEGLALSGCTSACEAAPTRLRPRRGRRRRHRPWRGRPGRRLRRVARGCPPTRGSKPGELPLEGSSVPSPTPYPTNAAGQTYGGAQEAAEADLQAVAAKRGENGYSWSSDLNGPMPMNPDRGSMRHAHQTEEGDPRVQVGRRYAVRRLRRPLRAAAAGLALRPDEGHGEQRRRRDAWAWWTRTTAGKAAQPPETRQQESPIRDRPVYVAFILGDFTRWLWSLPEGTSAPDTAGSTRFSTPVARGRRDGASAKLFRCRAIDLHFVGLRDRVKM